MQTEFGAADPLIDGLIADLRPVAPRRRALEMAVLLAIGGVESLLFVMWAGTRPDLLQTIGTPAFLWKAISAAFVAVLAIAATLLSLDPAAGKRPLLARLWWAIGAVLAATLVAGLIIEPTTREGIGVATRLQWREGLNCLVTVVILSVVPVLALGLLMRRGASVQPARTAAAAGLGGAAFAAFAFAFHCPHNDPLYVAVWYGSGVIGVVGLARLILPRVTRW